MALQAILGNLESELRRLFDSVEQLRVAIGDAPPDDSALVDRLDDQVLDLLGALQECRESARRSRRAVEPAFDFNQVRHELTAAQHALQTVARDYGEIASYRRLKDLEREASGRGRDWRVWAAAVLQTIEDCQDPVQRVSSALAACWQELAEHAGISLGAVGELRKPRRKKGS